MVAADCKPRRENERPTATPLSCSLGYKGVKMNNQEITIKSSSLTMSSREIADLVESRHDSVKRTIERLVNSSVIQSPPMVDFKNSNNVTGQEYLLNKRDSYIVVAQLSPEFTARLVDRWQELESRNTINALPDFTNPVEAARAWADAKESEMKALETIKEKDAMILAVADLNIRAGDVTIAEFAKNLAIEGMGQNNLFKWLKARGFLMDNNQPYQSYVTRGYFVMKPYPEKVNGEVKYRTMLTARGSAWLSKLLHAEYEID
jgi:phage regulator Rha-like protein